MKTAGQEPFGVRIVGFEPDLKKTIRSVFHRARSNDWPGMSRTHVRSYETANTLWVARIDQAHAPRTEWIRAFLRQTRHYSPIFLLSDRPSQRSASHALLREWLDQSGARIFEGKHGFDQLQRFLMETAERRPQEIIVNARFSDDGLHVRFADNARARIPFRSLRRIAETEIIQWDSMRIAGERTYITFANGGEMETPVPHDVLREFVTQETPQRKAANRREQRLTARSFGAKLRTARKEQGITQETLASKIGSSRWTIMRIEQGDYLPKVAHLGNFARALGLRVEDLLTLQS
jgi:DNA-binding XRE family transcriptional regulator